MKIKKNSNRLKIRKNHLNPNQMIKEIKNKVSIPNFKMKTNKIISQCKITIFNKMIVH